MCFGVCELSCSFVLSRVLLSFGEIKVNLFFSCSFGSWDLVDFGCCVCVYFEMFTIFLKNLLQCLSWSMVPTSPTRTDPHRHRTWGLAYTLVVLVIL